MKEILLEGILPVVALPFTENGKGGRSKLQTPHDSLDSGRALRAHDVWHRQRILQIDQRRGVGRVPERFHSLWAVCAVAPTQTTVIGGRCVHTVRNCVIAYPCAGDTNSTFSPDSVTGSAPVDTMRLRDAYEASFSSIPAGNDRTTGITMVAAFAGAMGTTTTDFGF